MDWNGLRLPLAVLLLATAGGCRSNAKRDLLEAELRTKERELRESQTEVERTRLVNQTLERDFMARQSGEALPPNVSLAIPKDITIGNGTGGVDNDNQPGDESLLVVVIPRDEDQQPIRAVGSLQVRVCEIMPGGVKVPLSMWEVSSADLRRTWKSGLLGSGYQVPLAWSKLPTQKKLRIEAQFRLADGRVFEADKDVPIRPFPMTAPVAQPPAPLPTGPVVP